MSKRNDRRFSGYLNRRNFIAATGKTAGSFLLMSAVIKGFATGYSSSESPTVGEVMDRFINEVPGAPFDKTVDTLKAGNRDIKVTGIVTTMFATIGVIQKAIDLGANFIIAHEPTFYNHADETDWLKDDDIYRYKINLLNKHNITVWRNHDYIHSHVPDGVDTGVTAQLGWQQYYQPKTGVAIIPATTLQTLIGFVKERLNISTVRYIGDLAQPCKKILLLPGAAGGVSQITGISKEQPDVLICGEIHEWETAEYVRDAQATGKKLALVVLGHIASEEPGSEYMVTWLKEKFPAIKVVHVPSKNSLSFL